LQQEYLRGRLIAEALEAPLLTADRRLADASGPRCEMKLLT